MPVDYDYDSVTTLGHPSTETPELSSPSSGVTAALRILDSAGAQYQITALTRYAASARSRSSRQRKQSVPQPRSETRHQSRKSMSSGTT